MAWITVLLKDGLDGGFEIAGGQGLRLRANAGECRDKQESDGEWRALGHAGLPLIG